jgi:phosphatidate phosphatase APP1
MARPCYIDLYVSFGVAPQGVPGGVIVRGRVLAGHRPMLGEAGAHAFERLRNSWNLLETDELPGIEVAVSLLGEDPAAAHRAHTDHEGFFAVRVRGPMATGAHRVQAVVESTVYEGPPSESLALVYPPGPGLAVLSDIDDTVLATDVRDRLALVRRVLLSTPEDLTTFPGAPELYRRFAAAGIPLVFISGSPWNLEPRLRAFFALRGFPVAPLLLKDLGVGRGADSLLDQESYKLRRIFMAMLELPERRFVLIGDSGERDPEIYRRVQEEYPERVAAIYIRRATAEDPQAPRFAGTVVFDDFATVAQDLETRGLLPAG